jgi:hypothetical protein
MAEGEEMQTPPGAMQAREFAKYTQCLYLSRFTDPNARLQPGLELSTCSGSS